MSWGRHLRRLGTAPDRLRWRWLLWLVLQLALVFGAPLGCVVQRTTSTGKAKTTVEPEVLALHQALLDAAKAGDIETFKALLTPASIALFESHFEAAATLPRPRGEALLGWAEVLRIHAELPPSARTRAPYPTARVEGALRLDIAAHPDARFFEGVATQLAH